ncbi:magnesium transporter CorA family protein (plasmid) [Deinococcus sp. KNUC1210]|uniref:magnesium transporter CorA family protein n=1 Tax=Deinococcus sp. KNUC1210 TaxID=2917691 RepID=UPI001EF0609C|nr:magnesium transporter CorA family protein [Deinococcus sp. KNUC1210]ULH17160.1 magnesium transporter CorA family protein [Deinococcus sp. KNUC1210]
MTVRALLYDADGRDQPFDMAIGALPPLTDRQLLWVDVIGDDPGELRRVSDLFQFHRESLRTLLEPVGRPGLDQYQQYVQLTVTAVEPGPAMNSAAAEAIWKPVALDCFFGSNFVVTVHAEPLHSLSEFDHHIREDSNLGALDSAAFLASLLDWHITSYFRVIEEFEEAVDDLDESVLLDPNDREFLQELVALRRRVGQLRRLLAPHREVFSTLAHTDVQTIGKSDSAAHFRTLYDRFERAMDSTEHARELIVGLFDLYMTSTARQTNEAVQVLTIITVSLGIVGAVAGLMGVNFTVEFFKSGTRGFLVMIAIIVALIFLALLLARRRRWI